MSRGGLEQGFNFTCKSSHGTAEHLQAASAALAPQNHQPQGKKWPLLKKGHLEWVQVPQGRAVLVPSPAEQDGINSPFLLGSAISDAAGCPGLS